MKFAAKASHRSVMASGKGSSSAVSVYGQWSCTWRRFVCCFVVLVHQTLPFGATLQAVHFDLNTFLPRTLSSVWWFMNPVKKRVQYISKGRLVHFVLKA